jgi:hypothetical protein
MPCSKGMTGCRRQCLHRGLVLDYRAERQRQEQLADQHSCGYVTERAEYLLTHPLITFRDWLRWHATAPERLNAAA